MEFTLKDYQQSAVADVLEHLRKARKRWHAEAEHSAFSLSAVVGAGKTVMAAAVFEALFFGDDENDFEEDPGAVVLWFSDNPSLNDQTKHRLNAASNKLKLLEHMVDIKSPFKQDKLKPRKIYFLNTQKLNKKANLVRGHGDSNNGDAELPDMPPESQPYSFWDILRNTTEDPNLTLYFVLDEAHRGMGSGSKSSSGEGDDEDGEVRTTIVQRLINGSGSVPPMPVVWGISATVDRFNAALTDAKVKKHTVLSSVTVDPVQVQESGLIKDTIVLDIPNEAGNFDSVLVRRATDKLKDSTAAWEQHSAEQDDADSVKPLMILQVENTPKHDDIGELLDVIFQRWPDLPTEAVAHVFAEHTTLAFGQYQVPYIPPEQVQDSTWIRVLIAKTAISTGWDCPRAEVMVSLRRSTTDEYIIQLLGRTLRTPLARRIPGNELLNSVACLLPYFDKNAVDRAVDVLKNGSKDTGVPPGRDVLVNPIEVKPSPAVPQEVWDVFLALPTQSIPQKKAKPVKRFTLLAHELAADDLVPDGGKLAHAELHKILDAARIKFGDEIAAAEKAVLTVEGKSVKTEVLGKGKSLSDFSEAADRVVIEDAYKRAGRMLGADLCRTYSEHLANLDPDKDDVGDVDDKLLEAHTIVAAMGLVPEVKEHLESGAEELATKWYSDNRKKIKSRSEERQEVYRQINAMSVKPQDSDLSMPKSRLVMSTLREADGTETPLPSLDNHMLSDENGEYPMAPSKSTSWETAALDSELGAEELVAWYRNPSGSGTDSLSIAYDFNGTPRLMRPDFLMFTRREDGSIGVSIVDPHSYHLPDAVPKLKGLAAYAEKHAGVYQRIDAIAEVTKGKFKVLDLTDEDVRAAIKAASTDDAEALYKSKWAVDYR